MRIVIATVIVEARGLTNRLRGGDRSGLTVPCHGCDNTDPHNGHLARGALTYLGGQK